jgi:DNA-binding NtrC family response regulator
MKESEMTDRPSLLFVDDEERIVKLLKVMFRSSYDVHTATSGREALAILEAHRIDVIVSDQRMPEMVGIELLSQVCRRWPNTVRILLTGYSDLVAIIGAVNEGEVFRFLNKPWNQDELRQVIAEAAEIARAAPAAAEKAEAVLTPPLGVATKLLAIDGVASDRQEMLEMFTRDYSILTASTMEEALEILQQEEIGVIVTNSEVDGVDVTDMLAQVARIDPSITVVATTSAPDADTIVKLINQGQIYRFAIKPLSPNVFRLAVSAAIREHRRRLVDPRFARQAVPKPAVAEGSGGLLDNIVRSLGRFTKVS